MALTVTLQQDGTNVAELRFARAPKGKVRWRFFYVHSPREVRASGVLESDGAIRLAARALLDTALALDEELMRGRQRAAKRKAT